MSIRTELDHRVKTMSEAEAYTVLRFVQFLEDGHVRPRLDLQAQPEVELVPLSRRPAPVVGQELAAIAVAGRHLLEDAREVPKSEWGVTLDGFSHLFHDLGCHLWVQPASGEAYTLAQDVPLGQVYFDAKGSEQNSVQVAVNRAGTVYSDFRYMHRIAEPHALYLREGTDGELADLIVETREGYTVLEVGLPDHPEPGLRGLSFLRPADAPAQAR